MERKALIRQYMERRPEMGVFQVRNTANGKVLIGSSADLPSMLNRQRAQLRLGAHPDRGLQADWRTFGAEAFVFETLDRLSRPEDPSYDPAADLAALLQIWMEKLEPYDDRGYNRPPRQACRSGAGRHAAALGRGDGL
jgi:hypothetical protein